MHREKDAAFIALMKKASLRRLAHVAPSHLTGDDQSCSCRMKNEHELCMRS